MYDLKKIKDEIKTLPKWDEQIGLQGTETIKDGHVGGMTNFYDKFGYEDEKKFIHPIFDIPYINSIMKEHNLYRTRLMNLKPKTCYTYHQDYEKRFHIPLITNNNCFFIIEDEVKRYPADGNWYIIDTTKKHTAVNASREDRIHLVGNKISIGDVIEIDT